MTSVSSLSALNTQTCHLPSLSPKYFTWGMKYWPGKFSSPFILNHSKKPSRTWGEVENKGQLSQSKSGAPKRNLCASIWCEWSSPAPGLFQCPIGSFFLAQARCEIRQESEGSMFIRRVSWRWTLLEYPDRGQDQARVSCSHWECWLEVIGMALTQEHGRVRNYMKCCVVVRMEKHPPTCPTIPSNCLPDNCLACELVLR